MVILKDMEPQTDCQKCPFMATDGMMCLALWATKHEMKHCVSEKILDDCPLVEVVNCKDCKYNDEGTCYIDGLRVCDDYFCASGGKERINVRRRIREN